MYVVCWLSVESSGRSNYLFFSFVEVKRSRRGCVRLLLDGDHRDLTMKTLLLSTGLEQQRSLNTDEHCPLVVALGRRVSAVLTKGAPLPHLNVGRNPGRPLLRRGPLHCQQLGSASLQHVRLDLCNSDLALFQLLHLQTGTKLLPI